MTRNTFALTAIVALSTAAAALAQAPPELPGPAPEHQWLKQLVGEWESQSEARMAPDQPPIQCTGTMTSRMLGEFWIVSELTGDMGGTAMAGVQVIGYDPSKNVYVGTWVDSMTSYIWHYEGTVDETGKKLTLEAEGPNFMADGKTTKFRDAYEFKSPDHIVATSSMLGEDGEWITFMTGDVRRKQ